MKRKTTVIILAIIITFIVIIIIALCLFQRIDVSDYRQFNRNIVWKKCEGNSIHHNFWAGVDYYKIADVPADEFIACFYYPPGLGAGAEAVVMMRSDMEKDLYLDASSAELFVGHVDDFTKATMRSYGEELCEQVLAQIDVDIATPLVDEITSFTSEKAFVPEDPSDWFDNYNLLRNEIGFLNIKFSIENYPNLIWTAMLIEYNDRYFIEIKIDNKIEVTGYLGYLECSDELNALIDTMVKEYGFN